ncbi:CGL24 [Auxenochlorella protothecoides x Auxenochlorella symbiontica]|uniref:Protein NEOXANTHIN-DEFICIENT 1 n=1 Tax=Auxenochlorella protothecoides TaxID=3075 RepID=A0A087SKI6_AUXPR|nr:hypothetical protein F751_4733 [Auxenochlorella protothecoides]KFM26240.1 hypothetical protein F751_4733 [Auxenochlorella protothecoides]
MGYGSGPWEFEGRALYQLSLVRVDEARRHIPADLPLVSLFGWTLGGLYLARYTSSPAGAFDELVALAGLVWDGPTSCAWAGRVLVNSPAALQHGQQAVGLPSHAARFQAAGHSAWWHGGTPGGEIAATQARGWGQTRAESAAPAAPCLVVSLDDQAGRRGQPGPEARHSPTLCALRLPTVPSRKVPRMKLTLPSFSGATEAVPTLLKYSLKMHARIQPCRRILQHPLEPEGEHDEHVAAIQRLTGGRAVLCLAFEDMKMEVQEPSPMVQETKKGGLLNRLFGRREPVLA